MQASGCLSRGHCIGHSRKPLSGPRLTTRAKPDDEPARPTTQLEGIVRRKYDTVQQTIEDMGPENLQVKLQDALSNPTADQYRLGQLFQQHMIQCRTTMIAEVPRLSPTEPASELATRAVQLVHAGFDAVCVRTDALDTPTPLQDLLAVVRAVRVPVLQRDWFIHPLQLVECKESGAAGALGIVCQVSAGGTATISSFAAALGLDAPVEVVNTMEIERLLALGVPSYAINCGVGVALSIPGISESMAKNLLAELPGTYPAIVGAKTLDEGIQAAKNGATCVLFKQEAISKLLDENVGTALLKNAVYDVRYALSGDD